MASPTEKYGRPPQNGYGQQAQPFLGDQYSSGYGNNVEMTQYSDHGRRPQNPFEENTAYGGASSYTSNPMPILDWCQAIDRGIDDLEQRLQGLAQLHRRVLNDQASPQQVDAENADIMTGYRGLVDKLRRIKSNPESGNPRNAPQVGRVDRRLKKSINDYQRVESDFRKQMQEQQARQYRIVRPDATEAEVREAVEEPNVQVFQQALLNSNRTGQSQSALSAVRARHAEIQRIEQTIVELAQLFQDLDVLVAEQEPMVQQIETKGEEIQSHIVMANEELGKGVKSARAARRKKWICFWICVLILVIIIAVLAVYFGVIQPNNNKKTVVTTTAAPATTTTAKPTATKAARAVGDVEAMAGMVVRMLTA